MGGALRRPIEAACHSNIYRPPECCYSTNDCSFVRTRSGMAKRKLKRMGYVNAFNLGSYGRAEGVLKQQK